MNIFENHNTCIGKYGNLTIKMGEEGISSKYLLSACRFHTENNIPIKILSSLFKQWNYYVMRNNPTDVNKLTFTEFRNILDNCKREYGIPNKVFDDGKVSVGRITSSKDLSKLPIKNDWCINKPNQYQKYMNDGWRFYLIDNGDTSDYIRYVLLMVDDNGKRYYYDIDNNVMNERDIAEFETYLTPEAHSFVENLQEQTIYKRNKQTKTGKNMKQTIRMSEGELNTLISETIKRVLNEHMDENNFMNNLSNKIQGARMGWNNGANNVEGNEDATSTLRRLAQIMKNSMNVQDINELKQDIRYWVQMATTALQQTQYGQGL